MCAALVAVNGVVVVVFVLPGTVGGASVPIGGALGTLVAVAVALEPIDGIPDTFVDVNVDVTAAFKSNCQQLISESRSFIYI